jgi:hypothetical protein
MRLYRTLICNGVKCALFAALAVSVKAGNPDEASDVYAVLNTRPPLVTLILQLPSRRLQPLPSRNNRPSR